ncbi:MAG: transporter substrate-binding domain-containing protein [Clostridiales bacterium]|nr:transporter substrate-binding domain-containing protein [Clostridiales bacterium]
MKRFITRAILIVIVASLVAALTVCFSACSTKDPDKLYVGLECAYSPFNYTQRDDSNDAVPIYNTNYKQIPDSYANGYDIMIAKKIAEELGKELVVVKMEWESLIPALNAGTVDLIIAGMSPTADRKEQIDFSDPYYQSNLVLVVRKDGGYADKTTLSQFSGAKVAAQQGTFHDVALAGEGVNLGLKRQTPLEDFAALINALKTGVIDAYIAEEPGAIENCASNPEFTYIHLKNNDTGFTATDEDTAIAVGIKKGSKLTDQINGILASVTQTQREEMMDLAIRLSTGENIVDE